MRCLQQVRRLAFAVPTLPLTPSNHAPSELDSLHTAGAQEARQGGRDQQGRPGGPRVPPAGKWALACPAATAALLPCPAAALLPGPPALPLAEGQRASQPCIRSPSLHAPCVQVAGNATVASMINLGGLQARGGAGAAAAERQPTGRPASLSPVCCRRGGAAGRARPAGGAQEGPRGQDAQHGARGGASSCAACLPSLPGLCASLALCCRTIESMLPSSPPRAHQICRYHTASALALRRVALEDVSLGGQTIK